MRILPLIAFCTLLPLGAQAPMALQEVANPAPDRWTGTVGAQLLSHSAFPGSQDNRTMLMPVFSAQYNRFYLGSSRVGVGFGGGVQLWRTPAFTWDLGLGVGERRPESRADVLAGMGDRKATLWAGTGVSWRSQGWHARATLAHGLADEAGTRGTVAFGRTFRLAPQWFLGTGLHAGWADATNLAYDFGITQDQAQRRAALVAAHDPRLTAEEVGPFKPGAGMRDAGGILTLGYRSSPKITYNLTVFGGKFQSQVTASPLVRKDSYVSAAVGFTYRWQAHQH
jgi:outer membrane scaffolding protein for murein synthesis (MipA/OmpV family)